MKPTFFKGIALGAVTAVLAIAATNALAGTGVGAVFNLGKVNGVNATSDLYGSANGAQLRVTNASSSAHPGILGYSIHGEGIHGVHTASAGTGAGVEGDTKSTDSLAPGVLGKASPSGQSVGVLGEAGALSSLGASDAVASAIRGDSAQHAGVIGVSDQDVGVQGVSNGLTGVDGSSQQYFGVDGLSGSQAGVHGRTNATGADRDAGVFGEGWVGVRGESTGYEAVSGYSPHGVGIFGESNDGNAAYFVGTTTHDGNLHVFDHNVRVDNGQTLLASGGSVHVATSATLQAENEGSVGEAAWLRLGNSSNSTAVLALIKEASGAGDYLDCYAHASGFTHTCHINSAGTFVGGSDFAESLPAVGGPSRYGVGDVVVASRARAGAVELSRHAHDRAVIGVYSALPGVLGARKGHGVSVARDEISVAITGIVPVKASAENGAIRPGDLLTTSSSPGRVMRAGSRPASGTVVGKALGSLAHGDGLVKVLVMQR